MVKRCKKGCKKEILLSPHRLFLSAGSMSSFRHVASDGLMRSRFEMRKLQVPCSRVTDSV